MNESELEHLSRRVEKLEAEIKTTRKEDPGYEFARICAVEGKKIWWASEEFRIEEKYQAKLKKYNECSSLTKAIFNVQLPHRADGSLIEYNDMRSSNFYGWFE